HGSSLLLAGGIAGGRGQGKELGRHGQISVRPRESGDPGPRTRTSPSLGPRFRGGERRVLLRPDSHIQVSNSYAVWGCLKTKQIRPLFAGSGPGGRPHSTSSVPLKARGSARRQGALPGLLRPGCPDYSGR